MITSRIHHSVEFACTGRIDIDIFDHRQTDKAVLLATEDVEPLCTHLSVVSKDARERDLYLSWGIFQVTVRMFSGMPHTRYPRPGFTNRYFSSFAESSEFLE